MPGGYPPNTQRYDFPPKFGKFVPNSNKPVHLRPFNRVHKVACKHPLDSSYAQATHNLTQRVSMAGIKGTHFFLGAIPASFPDVALTPTIKPVVGLLIYWMEAWERPPMAS